MQVKNVILNFEFQFSPSAKDISEGLVVPRTFYLCRRMCCQKHAFYASDSASRVSLRLGDFRVEFDPRLDSERPSHRIFFLLWSESTREIDSLVRSPSSVLTFSTNSGSDKSAF